jgi:hypothetical protein
MSGGVTFHSSERQMGKLLASIADGSIQLPDFQRDWVWDDEHIKGLLASVSMSYPIGTLMLLDTGNADVRFAARRVSGVELDKPVEPTQLILDGQQRLTTLYQVLESRRVVDTRDVRNKPLQRWYYFDMRAATDPQGDRDEAVVAVRSDRTIRDLKGVVLDLSTQAKECAAEMFPARLLLDTAGLLHWMLAYISGSDGTAPDASRMQRWAAFQEGVIGNFASYLIPVITMTAATPKDAVCQVFEKVNTGGVTLNVFELVTATYAANNFDLRADWDARRKRLQVNPALRALQNTDFLQAISLLSTQDTRLAWEQAKATGNLSSDDADRAPAVSCKRRDVLRLNLGEYTSRADGVERAFEEAGRFLLRQNIFSEWDVPYRTQLVPLAAILARLGPVAKSAHVVEKLARWFWCGIFGELYGSTTETRFARDLVDVLDWLDGGPEPGTILESNFQAARLTTMKSRNSAAYKGLYALLMRDGAQDFRTGEPVTIATYVQSRIDIHHIFPQKWCRDNHIDGGMMDSIVNKTPLSAATNQAVGGRAPSDYLGRIELHDGLGASQLDAILATHVIDAPSLRSDDFAGFYDKRVRDLVARIESATGKHVGPNTLDDGEGEPVADEELSVEHAEADFLESLDQGPSVKDDDPAAIVRELIENGESSAVEFKETARYNVHTNQLDKAVEFATLKTVAAFLNTNGGTLLIGVSDASRVVGLDHDFGTLTSRPNSDGLEQSLRVLFNDRLGKDHCAFIAIDFVAMDGVAVCVVRVPPSSSPVFVLDGGVRRLYIRSGNTTQSIDGEELFRYLNRRFTAFATAQ